MSNQKLLKIFKDKTHFIDSLALRYVDSERKDQKLKLQIWAESYQLFDSIKNFDGLRGYLSKSILGYVNAENWMREVFEETIRYCMDHFQPERKASFTGYLIDYTKFRLLDSYKKVVSEVSRYESLDENRFENGSCSYTDNYEQTESEDALLNQYLGHILTLIIRFCYKQDMSCEDKVFFSFDEDGRIKNIKQSGYYQMIYTEQVIHIVKMYVEYGNSTDDLNHEQEVFLTIRESFMDYLMRDICRSYKNLEFTELKFNDDILNNGDRTEVKLPVQETIYARYVAEILKLNRSQDSIAASVSKYRAKFKEKYRLIVEGR